ncbi:MAG TPA: hypothetical protein IAD10_08540 [Candidatus Fimicola cottocaccae]|nr:hypothetical protein [Candidatus Fimicola cottocaccae]
MKQIFESLELCVEIHKMSSVPDIVFELDTRKKSIEIRIFPKGWEQFQNGNRADYIISDFNDNKRLNLIIDKLITLKNKLVIK